jgi:hypothetical protein
VSQDPGLIDLYDAREGGGFPPPLPPIVPCSGEACQSPGPMPGDVTPASQQPGPGNVVPKHPKCRKGKVWSKKKKHCVPRKGKHNKHRRAAR